MAEPTTITPITAEAKSLQRACEIVAADLQALPEAAFDMKLGGAARTVADIIYEVNLVNDDIMRSMRDEASPEWPEGWITAPEDFRTKAVVIAGFLKSSEAVVGYVAPMTPDELLVAVQTERGETNRAERCRFMTLHLWYHSGQLNFIQTMLGDGDWHWG